MSRKMYAPGEKGHSVSQSNIALTPSHDVVGILSEATADAFFKWTVPCNTTPRVVDKKYIDSDVFSFSGCTWFLRLHMKTSNEWMSLFLIRKKPQSAEKNVTITLGVVVDPVKLKEKDPINHTFKNPPELTPGYRSFTLKDGMLFTNGYAKFLRRDCIYQRKFQALSLGKLTITCRLITGYSYFSKREYVGSDFLDPIDFLILSWDFQELFTKKIKCDVIIRVGDEEFHAHKTVLVARSPVFAAMFKHDMSEEKTGIVTIPDCDPEFFGDFLFYLYTGTVKDSSYKNAYHMYTNAVKYQVQILQQQCVYILTERLTKNNVCDVVTMADQYGEKELMSSAQKFFNKNLAEIFLTDEWSEFLAMNSPLANKLLVKMASSVKVET